MKAPTYQCPKCGCQSLQYRCAWDDYFCSACKADFSVLSTEQTHALYDGGPPKQATP